MLPYPQAAQGCRQEDEAKRRDATRQDEAKPAILKIIVEETVDANPAYPLYNHPNAPRRPSVFCFRTIKKPKRLPSLLNWDDK